MKTESLRRIAVAVGLGCLAPWLALSQSTYEPYTFTTIAGAAPVAGSTDGTNRVARFNWPLAMAMDSAGNLLVADYNNHAIRKIAPAGTNWVVTTIAGMSGVAGSADGTNSAARFNGPVGVALDSTNNIYVVDGMNDAIRRVTPSGTNWVVTTLAGRPGSHGSQDGTNSDARFYFSIYGAGAVTVDSASNLFVADTGNSTIRKMTPMGTNWVVTTLAGQAGTPGSADGTNSDAQFGWPDGVAVDRAGNLFVVDLDCAIRKVTPVGTNWLVTTLAGLGGTDPNGNPLHSGFADGTNSVARFNRPNALALDSAGNLYIADSVNDEIRKVTPVGTNWVVTTLAGMAGIPGSTDGSGGAVRFNIGYFSTYPYYYSGGGVAVDSAGNLYVADSFNNTIRKGYRPLAIASSGANFGFSGGEFGFALTGPAGQAAIVDASTDLVNWLPLWTNTFMVGPLQFSDPNSGSYSQRFYRAHRPQAGSGVVAPSVPQNPSVVAGDGQVSFSWQPPLSDGGGAISGYNVYVGTSALTMRLVGTTTSLTCHFTGLTNGQGYNFQVSATNSAGEGPRTTIVHAVPHAGSGVVPPSVPQNPGVLAGDGQVSFSWQPPLSDGGGAILGYNIYAGTSAFTMRWAATTSSLSYLFTGLTDDMWYNFQVSATNSAGEGPLTTIVSAMPHAGSGVVAPSAPQNPAVVAGDGHVSFSWQPPVSDGGGAISAYNIYIGTSIVSMRHVATTTSLTYDVTGLTNGVGYNFQVSATNSAGEGPLSTVVWAMPQAGSGVVAPSAP